jgi:hypothetical protein
VIYADVHVLVRTGPRGRTFRVYEGRTTYEVLEEGVPRESPPDNPDSANRSVGPPPYLLSWDRPGHADQGVPDGQEKEESKVIEEEEGSDPTAPRQLPLL